MSEKRITSTHGFRLSDTDKKKVTREIHCLLFSDGSYGIKIVTKTPRKQPNVTTVRFSVKAFNMLAEAVLMGQHHMDDFPCVQSEEQP